MNIFVLDQDPERAARYHCDRHVVKMVLETAQLLSTAVWSELPETAAGLAQLGLIYQPTHRGHPCTIWTAKNRANFIWLAELGSALAREYTFRYDREHRSARVVEALQKLVLNIDPAAFSSWQADGRRTPFAQAMPERYRSQDAVEAYRGYYLAEKSSIARWTRRSHPRWYSASSQQVA